eukprot:g15110.t1
MNKRELPPIPASGKYSLIKEDLLDWKLQDFQPRPWISSAILDACEPASSDPASLLASTSSVAAPADSKTNLARKAQLLTLLLLVGDPGSGKTCFLAASGTPGFSPTSSCSPQPATVDPEQRLAAHVLGSYF